MIALLFLGCGGDPPAVLASAGSFSALSYNVAGLPEGLSSSNPEVNTPQISPLLNTYDLVLVQEDFAYHEALEAEADHPYQSIPKIPDTELVNDGLNRFSRFPFEPVQRTRWEDCVGVLDHASDCLAEKGFSIAPTTFAEGIVVLVVNLHADASSEPEDAAARRKNFEQLAAALADEPGPLLLAGDTNLRNSRPEDAITYEAFIEALELTDVCPALGCTDDRIDRFFYRSGPDWTLEPTSWQTAEEFVTPAGEDLSDHLAVHVDWAWSR